MVLLLLLQACALTVPIGAECLVITEVVTSATDYAFDAKSCVLHELPGDTGLRPDWVEVCNPSDVAVDAGVYRLLNAPNDNPYNHHPAWPLPDRILDSGECLVVIADPDFTGLCPQIAGFDLDQELGAHLSLVAGRTAECADEDVRFERLPIGWSWARTGDRWDRAEHPSPGVAVLP